MGDIYQILHLHFAYNIPLKKKKSFQLILQNSMVAQGNLDIDTCEKAKTLSLMSLFVHGRS